MILTVDKLDDLMPELAKMLVESGLTVKGPATESSITIQSGLDLSFKNRRQKRVYIGEPYKTYGTSIRYNTVRVNNDGMWELDVASILDKIEAHRLELMEMKRQRLQFAARQKQERERSDFCEQRAAEFKLGHKELLAKIDALNDPTYPVSYKVVTTHHMEIPPVIEISVTLSPERAHDLVDALLSPPNPK